MVFFNINLLLGMNCQNVITFVLIDLPCNSDIFCFKLLKLVYNHEVHGSNERCKLITYYYVYSGR